MNVKKSSLSGGHDYGLIERTQIVREIQESDVPLSLETQFVGLGGVLAFFSKQSRQPHKPHWGSSS